jgi:hypothetical protein
MTLLLTTPVIRADAFDHGQWDSLLRLHVSTVSGGHTTQVDYNGFVSDRGALKVYLDQLAGISRGVFDSWSKQDQLAFLINAYNAWTVELVLTGYPDIESIKDLGNLFQSPWEKTSVRLFGEACSLDDIEHGLIRGSGRYNDPRIHFAVNCASIGCPALRPEAYQGTRLEGQLQEQTTAFLSDRSRNHLDADSLQVSSIFKWYEEDFQKGWLGLQSLPDFFIQHKDALGLTASDVDRLRSGDLKIKYLRYDWRLNAPFNR